MRKVKTNETGWMWKTMLIGATVSIAIVSISCAVFAKLLISEVIKEEHTAYAVCGMLMLSGLGAGLVVRNMAKERLVLMVIGAEVIYLLGLLLINTFGFRNGYDGLLPNTVMILAGGALAILPWDRGKGRGGSVRRRGSIVKLTKKHAR